MTSTAQSDIIRPTKFAMDCTELQHEYSEVWQGLKKNFAKRNS
jgi:hypothetical protein